MTDVLTNTFHNVIWREVECFTDELIYAKNLYCFSDLEAVGTLISQFDTVNKEQVSDNQVIDYENIDSESLLVLAIFKDDNHEISEVAERFRKKGGRVVLLTNNRESQLANLANEIIGISINQSDIDRDEATEPYCVYVEITEMLVGHINKRLSKSFK